MLWLSIFLVEANELCPTTVASVGDEDCPMNCTSDDQCADDEICCGNGCGQMCVTRCPQVSIKQISYILWLYKIAFIRIAYRLSKYQLHSTLHPYRRRMLSILW